MKENNEELKKEKTNSPEKSMAVAIEQFAQLLRKEAKITTTLKMQEKQAKQLSLQSLGPSLSNSIGQVARLLRTQVPKDKPATKRSYQADRPSSKKKDKKL